MDKRLPLRFYMRPLWGLFCLGLLLVLLVGHPVQGLGGRALAQSPAAQLVRDGVTAYHSGNYAQAIALWSQALPSYVQQPAERAIVYENLARAQQQIGETQAAIAAWEAAAADYQASNNAPQFGRMLSEQAQVYISLGQHQRAAALLCGGEPELGAPGSRTVGCSGGAYSIALATNDLTGQAAVLGNLAETYRLRGVYETARVLLEAGLGLVQSQAELGRYEASMLNGLGNTYARLAQLQLRRSEAARLLSKTDIATTLWAEAEADRKQALTYLNQSIAAAAAESNAVIELRSQLSLLLLYQSLPGAEDSDPIRQRLGQLIGQLPASRETAYAATTLAKAYQPTEQNFSCMGYQDNPAVQQWLETGRRLAAQIQDARAESFALGELGHLAECQKRWGEAARLTHLAQIAASNALESADSLYLWEWQLGRIYRRQNQIDKALGAYKQAIATLESIRTNILTADRELQFDFRDTVEPVYRQYIQLQLESSPDTVASQATTKQAAAMPSQTIAETLKTVDSLRLAELQNFFGDDCVLVASSGARDRLLAPGDQTTVITSVVLENRTALIANFPDGDSKVVWLEDSDQIKSLVNEFRGVLKRYTDRVYSLAAGEKLYQQLIAPLEADLQRTQTQTLVFVHDGFLRNIPMAALYDGGQYLIQRYAIATTPSLGLTAPSPTKNQEFRALAVGISQNSVTASGREFPDLESVPAELASISRQLPGSKTLLNEEFTVEQFEQALRENSYSILHLATHGQFSTVPEETFVITGPDSSGTSGELTFGQLETLIRESAPNADPVDLITLTACETATGDDRATLGLAGVAIRAGARSAIASLWKLDDATAASLVPDFYRHLRDSHLSKAKALQAAQVAAIEANPNAHPGRWAPLVLVGNWQ